MLREGKEYIDDTIFVDEHEIVHLYGPPHLLKCLRFNLLKKDLNYTWESKSRKDSWSHIETAFQIDKYDEIFRLLKKLTEAHIYPKDKQKIRVNLCKNVFSHTTAVVMMNMCKYKRKSPDGKLKMNKEGEDTALLIYLIDKIFDSLNCDEKSKSKKNNEEEGEEENEEGREKSLEDYNYKQYISTSDDCPYEVLWNDAIRLFDSMRYVENNPKDKERPNVENFFGQIRQHGIRNTKPTTIAFADYYKSILINNIVKNNLKGTNCENDSSSDFLVTVKTLLNHKKIPTFVKHRGLYQHFQLILIIQKIFMIFFYIVHYQSE